MQQQQKQVIDYLVNKEVSGWVYLGNLIPEHPSYLHSEDGIQMIFSFKDFGLLRSIHVSLCPIRGMKKDLTDQDHELLVIEKSAAIIESFFGDRDFAKNPSDPRAPLNKNFFALLKENE